MDGPVPSELVLPLTQHIGAPASRSYRLEIKCSADKFEAQGPVSVPCTRVRPRSLPRIESCNPPPRACRTCIVLALNGLDWGRCWNRQLADHNRLELRTAFDKRASPVWGALGFPRRLSWPLTEMKVSTHLSSTARNVSPISLPMTP